MHNAHGTAEILHAGLAAKEHLQADAHHLDIGKAGIPGLLYQRTKAALHIPEIKTIAQGGSAVLVGIFLHLHGKILKFNLFPVPQNHQIMAVFRIFHLIGLGGKHQGKIGVHIDPSAVHLEDPVAHHQPGLLLRSCQGTARLHGGDHRHVIALLRRKEDGKEHQPRQEIHHGTCHQDDDPLPPGGGTEGAGIFRAVAVLALHLTVAAEGDQADGVQRLALFLFPQGGSHEHGKFVYLHAKALGGGKMPQLMDENEQTEKDNSENDTECRHN